MRNKIFVDTSGFYAVLVKKDDSHQKAKRVFWEAGESGDVFVTTDYILDETVTLLRSRGYNFLLSGLINIIFNSRACQVKWMDAEKFRQTWRLVQNRSDQDWSFTDCFSFGTMDDLKIQKALTKDNHFKHAGYEALLVEP